jgi:hypothetical protein
MIDDQAKPESIKIDLPRGGTLEVEIQQGFKERVASTFELSSVTEVTHDHIRMFIYGSFKKAIDDAEREIKTDE